MVILKTKFSLLVRLNVTCWDINRNSTNSQRLGRWQQLLILTVAQVLNVYRIHRLSEIIEFFLVIR